MSIVATVAHLSYCWALVYHILSYTEQSEWSKYSNKTYHRKNYGRPTEYSLRPLFDAAVWLTPTSSVPCSNAAKTRNPLKFSGVLQTNETISNGSGPKFTILEGHVEEILLLNKFFRIVDTYLSCEDIARESCAIVRRWRFFASFLHPVFPASRVQHISDLHSKFALRPHHV